MREQVEAYERSGGREANTLPRHRAADRRRHDARQQERAHPQDTVDARRARRRVRPHRLLRRSARHPVWYHNLKADPRAVTIQDGPEPFAVEVTELDGEERTQWWERAVAAYPPYAEYQAKTDRQIPVFKATPTTSI